MDIKQGQGGGFSYLLLAPYEAAVTGQQETTQETTIWKMECLAYSPRTRNHQAGVLPILNRERQPMMPHPIRTGYKH